MNAMTALPDNAPRPRLCHVTKWPDFDGYGFNLHAEKSRPGQFIGQVDKMSPAEMAGLREGDRIIEVNGVNINLENHKQVVQRIKAVPDETRLLVVDVATEKFFRDNDLVIAGDLPNILSASSVIKEVKSHSQKVSVTSIDRDIRDIDLSRNSSSSTASGNNNKYGSHAKEDLVDHRYDSGNNRDRRVSRESHERRSVEDDRDSNHSGMSGASSTEKKAFSSSSTSGSSPRSTPSPEPASINSKSGGKYGEPKQQRAGGDTKWDGLNLNMTAAEMRSRIGSKKKRDPRKDDRMDFRKKFEIIDDL